MGLSLGWTNFILHSLIKRPSEEEEITKKSSIYLLQGIAKNAEGHIAT